MLLMTARILVIFGIALFGLRGVLGALAPAETAGFVVVLFAAAATATVVSVRRGRCRIGELACRRGLLSSDGVAHILSLQKSRGGRFGEIALRENFLSSEQLGKLLALQAE